MLSSKSSSGPSLKTKGLTLTPDTCLPSLMHCFLPIYTMIQRELIRFYRQRSRVLGALMQPLLFLLLIGTGLDTLTEASYRDYFFPGILLMVIMFTSIFSTISIIEDRNQGILQDVLVAPVTPGQLVIGRTLGGALLGLIQAPLFLLLLLTPWLHLTLSLGGLLMVVLLLFATAIMLTALGIIMAWTMESTQGYHALMSVFLFPMWVFSGAIFPVDDTHLWLYTIMILNPMTHALVAIRNCFTGADLLIAFDHQLIPFSCAYFLAVTGLLLIIAVRVVRR